MTAKSIAIEQLKTPFRMALAMPGSKSYANRAIIAACLANGKTIISNATPCDDVVLMVKNLQAMGFSIHWSDESSGELTIKGGIPAQTTKNDSSTVLDCSHAGTTVRFITSLACIVPGRWEITGSPRMRTRPMGELITALQSLGARIDASNGFLPLKIHGGWINGGNVTIDASRSSQFLSSLLLIAPMLNDGLIIRLLSTLASPPYLSMTKEIMQLFGVEVIHETKTNDELRIMNNGHYISPGALTIEGDWSAAGAWLVLSALTGSSIDYANLNPQSLQGDRMLVDGLKMLREGGDFTLDCSDLPDQVMNLAVFAAFRSGTTIITGAENLRLKESNRLQVITNELQKVEINIVEQQDGLIIYGKPLSQFMKRQSRTRKPCHGERSRTMTAGRSLFNSAHGDRVMLDPHDDHRMAMAFGVLGSLIPGVAVADPQCVTKSYPRFFEDLKTARNAGKPIAIVGMRGSGKSSLARRLGAALGLKVIDTDARFVEQLGPIADFVQAKGWEAFRREEEKIISEGFVSGVIISLGGGAIELQTTRELLKKHAIVIWMQMSEWGTVQRLKRTKRPPLTGLPLAEEVRNVLAKRDPLYKELATIVLPECVPFARQVPFVLGELNTFMSCYDLASRRFAYQQTMMDTRPPSRRRERSVRGMRSPHRAMTQTRTR